MVDVVNRNIRLTNEIFIKSFDKDTKEDEDAYIVFDFVFSYRNRIKLASKIIDEYEYCHEYTPRVKKGTNNKTKQSSRIEEEMQVETIPEEEATKIVVEGTHDYPSGPGKLSDLSLLLQGVPLGDSTTVRTEPNKSAIDLAVKALKEKERQQKQVIPFYS